MKTPVLLLIFNRPEKTRQVLGAIRKAQPEQLFIAADGPRPNYPDDLERCRQTRSIVREIDWPCTVRTLFRDINAGCKQSVSSALDWFFGHVEEGIIFEDDCLPDPSFFPYCEELLARYRYEPRIMHITGDNFQQDNLRFQCASSYYFSRIPQCWGWATWRRAWSLYDIQIKAWQDARSRRELHRIFEDKAVAHRWEYLFDQDAKDITNPLPQARLDWDGRWGFAVIMNHGLCIVPRTNLVSNIGFDRDARIARDPDNTLAHLPIRPMSFPLQHPETIAANSQADAYIHRYIYQVNRYWHQRVRWFFKSRFTKQYLYMKKAYRRLRSER